MSSEGASVEAAGAGDPSTPESHGLSLGVVALFGIPVEESPERFEESLRLLLEIWSGEPVTWKGEVRPPMSDVRVEPAPVQRPHPPVWIGGGLSQRSADLSAELGLPLMLP